MKFGVIAPSTNTSVQPEFDEMRPRGVTNHFARIHIPDMSVDSDEDFENLVRAIEAAQELAIDRVMTCRPQHLVMGMSAETFWDGMGGAEKLLVRMQERAGVKVTMGSHACEAALKAIGGIKRIAVITPYMPVGDRNVVRYFSDVGYEVKRIKGFKCRSPVLIAHVTKEELRDAILELDGDDIDAIVQVGTNLAMARISDQAEFWINKPVIAINVATYWHALRTNGIHDQLEGFGQLLANH
ncbi:MAG TPA: Asp/Glu racemase [Devosia sp.]|jgi:maleate isomerase|nr:Asp/Glu racemase [Devosia sp.]